MNKPQILVVEDDKAVRNLITTTLDMHNYHYRIAVTGGDAITELGRALPDICLLDLGLPDLDGMEVIYRIRERSNLPIIVISARNEEKDKVDALDAGADDYLTKPFSIQELLARVRVALRRVRADRELLVKEPGVYLNGGLKIDFDAACVYQNGAEIHLTPIEYRLLCLLARNTGKVLTHNFILREIWSNALPTDTPSLRVFMATLRKKIEEVPSTPRYIQTHVGIGYRMVRIPDEEEGD